MNPFTYLKIGREHGFPRMRNDRENHEVFLFVRLARNSAGIPARAKLELYWLICLSHASPARRDLSPLVICFDFLKLRTTVGHRLLGKHNVCFMAPNTLLKPPFAVEECFSETLL
jgi:hypothetical protein